MPLRLRRTCGVLLVLAPAVGCGGSEPSAHVADIVNEIDAVAVDATDAGPVPDVGSVDADVAVAPDVSDGGADAPDAVVLTHGWVAGGLLATYERDGELLAWRLDPTIDFALTDTRIATICGDEPCTVRWRGGLLVDEPGPHRVRLLAGGPVAASIDGVSVLAADLTGSLVVAEGTAELDVGWHRTFVQVGFDPGLPLARLLVAPPGGELGPVVSERLAWPDAPPDVEPPRVVSVEPTEVWPFGARIRVVTSAPANVYAQIGGADGVHEAQSAPDDWTTSHLLTVSLEKAEHYAIAAVGTDLWGRTVELGEGELDTPADGDFMPGGLLGAYHEGMAFETLRMERIDPEVRFPDAVGEGSGGSFGAPMAPDQFSVRWVGALRINEPGAWRVAFGTDDGQRMWLDGQLVAEDWQDHGTSWAEATLDLAGGWHPIVLEMYENGGGAAAHLQWEGPNTPRGPVPPEALGIEQLEDDGELPVVTSFEVVKVAPGEAMVRWTASELARAVVRNSGVVVLKDVPATGGQRRLTELPSGPTVLSLVLTDLVGGESEKALVEVEIPAVPEP